MRSSRSADPALAGQQAQPASASGIRHLPIQGCQGFIRGVDRQPGCADSWCIAHPSVYRIPEQLSGPRHP